MIGVGAVWAVVSCGAPMPPTEEPTTEPATAAEDHSKHSNTFATGPTYADSVNEGIIPKDTLKTSVRRVTMGDIGDCHVHIEYGSPGVRGRNIWGGLVAYGDVWVTGAHSATSVRFSKPVIINGKQIEAGTYAFFTIPDTQEWTLILNTRYEQHLADDYNAAEDVVRVKVKPATHPMVQRLTYSVEANPAKEGSGFLVVNWETVEIQLPFEVVL